MMRGICFGKTYCHRGIPMLKTRIQLPVGDDGEPMAPAASLLHITEQYAEQTLLPAICESYDGLGSVAEKMHFEPYGYRHIWHAEPRPGSSGVLTVRIETELTHGRTTLRRTEQTLCLDPATGRIVRAGRDRQKEKRRSR